jgi:NAD(P)-dependent dehydrogenase (short-subunit alcohol dehydrogenase family)
VTGTVPGGDRQRVVVVTGGGGGIGAAIAEELGRQGAFVVTVDPLVSVDGSELLPPPEETTAGRIVAAGGSAQASSVSVTDRDGVRALFESLVRERGGLDAVINVAGITRPTGFAKGSEGDWLDVLDVHLNGYRNVLDAALPIMAAAGHGRILGVTSGSGWRPADAGAYSCAKRAVAALTWQLGRHAPPGVTVNAISPIAATRMVTAALARAPRPAGGAGQGAATGGLSLASMPTPEQLGPIGAHLVGVAAGWCSGQVVFTGGSELAVVDEPRLVEVIGTDGAASLPQLLHAFTTKGLVPAEADQATAGGANARFTAVLDGTAPVELPGAAVSTCAIVTDQPEAAVGLAAALDARGVSCTTVVTGGTPSFGASADSLRTAAAAIGPLDAVVVALAGDAAASGAPDHWQRVLAEHDGIAAGVHADACWARAVADESAASERPVRLVTLTDATTAGGRSRAQAGAQLARAARGATGDRVTACTVSVEAPDAVHGSVLAELAAHLVCSPDTPSLSGAELVCGAGWLGLRSHPRPAGSVAFAGGSIPPWLDSTLRAVVAARSVASLEEDR